MKPREWWVYSDESPDYEAAIVDKLSQLSDHCHAKAFQVIEKSAYDAILEQAIKLRSALDVYHQTRRTSFTDLSTLAIKEFDEWLKTQT